MQVIRASTVIRAKRSEVWEVFTNAQAWESWYGGVLERVDPSWEEGGRLIWAIGPPSKILEIIPLEHLLTRSDQIKTTWTFTEQGGHTLVELESDFRVGTMVVADPAARQRQSDGELNGLRKYVQKRYRKWYQFWR